MSAQCFIVHILFVFLLSVICMPLHGINNNPSSPEKNKPHFLIPLKLLSKADYERSILGSDENLKQLVKNQTADEKKSCDSFIESCIEKVIPPHDVFDHAANFVIDREVQKNNLAQSPTNVTLSSSQGEMEKMLSHLLSGEGLEPLEEENFVELPLPIVPTLLLQDELPQISQNKISPAPQKKQSERYSVFQSNQDRRHALANKQHQESHQRAHYERGRSQSARNMNRIAHRYDNFVVDAHIKQEIELLADNFLQGRFHELISEYKNNPYNNDNLRGSYIISGAIKKAEKLSPYFASHMNQAPEQYEDRSLGQEISGAWKSTRTIFNYLTDSKYRKVFGHKEKKRKQEKRQRKERLYEPAQEDLEAVEQRRKRNHEFGEAWRRSQEQKNPYAELIQQLEKEAQDLAAQHAHDPQQQLENLYQILNEQLTNAQESGDRGLIERCKDRLDALRETIENPELILEISANFDQIVLDHCNYTELFDKTHGTPLERQLNTELCNAIRISSYQLAQHGDNQQVHAIAPVIHEYAAIAANTNNLEAAFHLSDFCHGLTRLSNDFINLCNSHPATHVAQGIATGACNSAINYATYAFNNPGYVALDLALGAVCPPAVAVRHLCILAKNAYQNRDDISHATQQFLKDIYNNKYLDSEWLAQHAQGLSQLLCDVFVSPRVGQKIARCSTISPLANGLRKQKEVVQACIRQGVNTAAQKAADSLQTIFKEAGDALKTGNPQPAFAGVDNGTHLNMVSDQPRRSERLMKKGPAQNKQLNENSNLAKQSNKELLKSKSSYEKLIQEHQEKLADYIKNPDAHDNKGLLKGVSPEVRNLRIHGRVRELTSQINKQQNELAKINDLINS